MQEENNWNAINETEDPDLTSLLNKVKLSKLSSHSPIAKIKKNLLTNIILSILVSLSYIFIFIYFRIWQVQLAIGIVFIFSVWAIYATYLEYRKMDSNISASTTVLEEMKRHYHSVIQWMKTQQKVALFIYPVSTAGGFMLGGVMGSGKPVATLLQSPFVLTALLISILVLVPVCYYTAKWMFNYSFGKYLKALNKNIAELEMEK